MEIRNLIDFDASYTEDLENWGLDDVAYLKKDVVDDTDVWAIYGAEGKRMGYASDRSVALALICQNDLTAMSVH